MKKIFFKGIAGILAAVLVAFLYFPMNTQAATTSIPAISLLADWYNTDHGTFISLTNRGSYATNINGHVWQVYEKAVDNDKGTVVLDYTETRTVITDPIYVNTGKFRENAPVTVTLVVTCADFGYAYTINFTIKNNENIYQNFSCVTSASGVLYNGGSNKTLTAYKNTMGALARASVNAFMPAGYMTACEGAIVFNYYPDYVNKNGVICINIPEGYQASNRTYKLMTIGEGGQIAILDDLDLNPATITSAINFNGFACVLIYTESDAAAAATTVPTAATGTVPVATITPTYNYISNYKFIEEPQGLQCMNAFTFSRPFGYVTLKNYSIYVNSLADVTPKAGYVTINVEGNYSDYKLITVDKNGATQVLSDCDAVPGTATFLLNFNGYACQLIAK